MDAIVMQQILMLFLNLMLNLSGFKKEVLLDPVKIKFGHCLPEKMKPKKKPRSMDIEVQYRNTEAKVFLIHLDFLL